MVARVLCLLALLAARAGDRQEPPDAASRAELVARDARVSFTQDSAGRARAAFEAGLDAVEQRAVAVLALGGAVAAGERGRIESMAMAMDGKPIERRAALYAFGEMGPSGLAGLERALERDTAGLEDALCVALSVAGRRGASGAGERLRALAAGEGVLAEHARAVLDGRPDGPDGVAWVEYYELRWRAARAYGLVDGRRGQKALAAELFADEEFLDRVVLAAARVLPTAQVEAHFAEILDDGERIGALRVAAVHMPGELAAAYRSGRLRPSLAAWHAMLAEIELQGAERASRELVEIAFELAPELETKAGVLLLRAGGNLDWHWVAARIEQGTPRERAALVEACGERDAKEWTLDLVELLERRPDLALLGEGVVAAARLGHPPATAALETSVGGPAARERDQIVSALARVLHDRDLWRYAEAALRHADLPREQRAALDVGLALGGSAIERTRLRAALTVATDPALRLRCVRALAQRAEQADLDTLGAFFPVGLDLDLDVELGVTLVRARHPAITGIGRAALWKDGWNRSILAGGLLFRIGGRRLLLDEIGSAPRTAREQDLRRVGFALGEWGGLGAVEELARTHAEGDPVLQGAVLGALASRATEPTEPAIIYRPPRAERPATKGKAGPRKKRAKKGAG